MASEAVQALLKHAMQLHSRGEIDAALTVARDAVAQDPYFGEGWAYLGNTLVTRKRLFADGLEALERAAQLCPRDAAVYYTLGWCREFAANALDRPKRSRPHQPVAQDASTLYAMAKAAFLHALELDPEEGMRGDIEDMLDVIANATGEPWREGE
ncbi:MAG: tetratricopeptide repeat protein [Dehalococcoidia bacterium]